MARIVLITGASSGYGKATAKAFKEQGDTVIMAARNMEKLEVVCKEIGGEHLDELKELMTEGISTPDVLIAE